MTKITLNQFIFCDNKNKTGQAYTQINCTHWNLKQTENNLCEQHCSLKNTRTVIQTCKMCKERNPIADTSQVKIKTPADEIKNKLPQFNFYDETKFLPQNKNFKNMAASYINAEGSQILQGKVSEEVFNKRKEQCMECDLRKNVNPQVDEIGWCGGCGCSTTNPRAGLSQKLWMPSLSCPINKFGKEDGTGFKLEDAKNSVSGIIKSVTSLFNKNKDQN